MGRVKGAYESKGVYKEVQGRCMWYKRRRGEEKHESSEALRYGNCIEEGQV
jgi:hypothetical protein